MRALGILGVSMFFLVLVGACAPGKTVSSEAKKDSAIVYAYIDLSKSPTSWQQATVICRDKKGKDEWWRMRIDRSLFYIENVPQGTCWMGAAIAAVANGSPGSTYHYTIGEKPENNPTTTVVPRSGANFMGTFRFEPKGSDFQLVRVNAPSEKEVLKKLLPRTEGTAWNKAVKQRLQSL